MAGHGEPKPPKPAADTHSATVCSDLLVRNDPACRQSPTGTTRFFNTLPSGEYRNRKVCLPAASCTGISGNTDLPEQFREAATRWNDTDWLPAGIAYDEVAQELMGCGPFTGSESMVGRQSLPVAMKRAVWSV